MSLVVHAGTAAKVLYTTGGLSWSLDTAPTTGHGTYFWALQAVTSSAVSSWSGEASFSV